ncbi:hypothetical protein M1293_03410 [Candidatus Parvarchaeota archaeon]|nr:hypothetical protein [Candidatus Parvarchaeota archaeon]
MFGFDIGNYEKEFKTDKLESRHVFYDLYIKSDDPQSLRNEILESITEMDYKTLLNELSKFEDTELEETFRGGNAKPIRALIKAAKDNKKGPKYPLVWKTGLIVGIILLITFLALSRNAFYGGFSSFGYSSSSFLLYAMIASFIIALIGWLVKKVVPVFLWIKIIGIYDPTEETANVRIILSGECKFKDKDSYSKLENDMAELYSILSRKYSNKLNKKQMARNINDALSLGTRSGQNLSNKMREVEKESADLERNFVAGKISEQQYKELKAEFNAKKAQLETLFDLMNG